MAQVLLQPLGELYQRTGRQSEFRALRHRAFVKLEESSIKLKTRGKNATQFWMYLRGVDANELLAEASWNQAKSIYQEILEELLRSENRDRQSSIAVQYHQLGRVAEEQRDFKEARKFYNKSRLIREEIGDIYGLATDYHHLGNVSFSEHKLDEAVAYYRRSASVYKNVNDFYRLAGECYQLGVVEIKRENYEKAVYYLLEALEIYKKEGDELGRADILWALGNIALIKKNLKEAKEFYNSSLAIFDDSKMFHKVAGVCYQLGILVQEQGKIDDSVAYHQKSLKYYLEVSDFYSAGKSYAMIAGSIPKLQK